MRYLTVSLAALIAACSGRVSADGKARAVTGTGGASSQDAASDGTGAAFSTSPGSGDRNGLSLHGRRQRRRNPGGLRRHYVRERHDTTQVRPVAFPDVRHGDVLGRAVSGRPLEEGSNAAA